MIGIDPLDMKAMLDHHDRELARFSPKGIEQLQPSMYCATSQDMRVIDLVAQFNAADERGRNTMLRMAQVMPKGDR